MALTEGERYQLSSFRKAAQQVRDASIIAEGHRIEIVSKPGQPGYVDLFIKLLQEEPFRSLALAIRLAYMQGEPANFNAVCNLLASERDETIRARVAALRQQYRDALRDKDHQIVISDGSHTAIFTAQGVFETWLYGMVFHQDPDRQPAVQTLTATGYEFPLSVQSTALQLAGRIIDLDDVVADFLKEPRLERL